MGALASANAVVPNRCGTMATNGRLVTRGRNSGTLLVPSTTTSNGPPPPLSQRLSHGAAPAERKAVASTDPPDLNPVHHGPARASRPAAGDQLHVMAPAGDAAEQLVQVDL